MGNHCCSLCLKISFVTFYETLDPGRWIPPWSTRVIKEKGAIEVKIGHSPPRFNLTQFKLYLFKRDFYENMDVTAISYTEPVSFIFTILKRRKIIFSLFVFFQDIEKESIFSKPKKIVGQVNVFNAKMLPYKRKLDR